MTQLTRVLLITNDPSTVDLLQEFLNAKEYKTTIETGVENLQKIKQEQPYDLVLLDTHLLQLAALEILRQVRVINQEIVAIIIITADEETIGKQAIDIGAFDCVIKPLNLSYLNRSLFHATLIHNLANPTYLNQNEFFW